VSASAAKCFSYTHLVPMGFTKISISFHTHFKLISSSDSIIVPEVKEKMKKNNSHKDTKTQRYINKIYKITWCPGALVAKKNKKEE
jgi:hypothetical protein